MSKTNVIVDTSVWVSFFRNSPGAECDILSHLIEEKRACLTGPVVAELMHGAKNHSQLRYIQKILTVLPYLEVTCEDWEVAGNTLLRLRKRGKSLTVIDAVIATVAQRNDAHVLTLDSDFQHFDVPLVSVK